MTMATEAGVAVDVDTRLAQIVATHRDEILDVSHRIHADPGLVDAAWREHRGV